ncbi:MAG: tetratricopeptide repeat protein [Candidatus Hydrogenedens sp.]|nr:tetratricopeptide repeat protein [Candidatus Hydrogenedens sp.]
MQSFISYRLILCTSLLLCGCTTANGQSKDRWLDKPVQFTDQGKAMSHYIAGSYYSELGRFKEAYEEISQVPELDPSATTPTLRLIRDHIRKQEFDQALAMAERAVERAPEDANYWIVLGQVYQQLKRYDDAIAALGKAIDLNPDNMLGYGAMVDLQESTNDLVSAVDIYERLLQLSPDNAAIHYQLGLNLIRINDPQGAMQAFERALELNDTMIRGRYLLGTLYLENGEPGRAVEQLSQYLRARPGDPRGAENLMGGLVQIERYDEAMGVMSLLLNGQDHDVRHRVLAMYLYLVAGKAAASEALEPTDGAPYFGTVFSALARRAQQLPYEAKAQSLDSIEGDLQGEADQFLSDLLYLFGEEKTAAWLDESFGALLEKAPASNTLRFLRGQLYMKIKDYRRAAEQLSALLERNAMPPAPLHYSLAVCYEELEDFTETEHHLKAYLELVPDDADVINFLGYLYAEEGVKLDEAMELLNKALSLDPGNPYFMDSIGWVYYKRGDAKKAVEYIQNAIYGMDSDDPILRDHLGDAYLLDGDVERAIAEWERAIRLDRSIEGVQEKLDQYRGATSPGA